MSPLLLPSTLSWCSSIFATSSWLHTMCAHGGQHPLMAITTGKNGLRHLFEVADGGACGALPVFIPRRLRIRRLKTRGHKAPRNLHGAHRGCLLQGWHCPQV